MPRLLQILCFALSLMTAGLPPGAQTHVPSNRVFNVKDFGASGRKEDNAQEAIQKAIDACAQAGGGMVYVPPGSYTSGTIHLRSHVRLYVESGATIFSSTCAGTADTISVSIYPGAMAFTVMPLAAPSCASALVKP